MKPDEVIDKALNALAIKEKPNVSRWVGVRQGSRRRMYVNHLDSNAVIETESSNHPRTRRAERAINACRQEMVDRHKDAVAAFAVGYALSHYMEKRKRELVIWRRKKLLYARTAKDVEQGLGLWPPRKRVRS